MKYVFQYNLFLFLHIVDFVTPVKEVCGEHQIETVQSAVFFSHGSAFVHIK